MTIHRERVTAVAGGPMRGRLMPMIEISTATDRDYSVRLAALKAGAPDTPDFSGDCSDLSTFIWYWSHAGRGHAKRIAHDLEREGTAVVYPSSTWSSWRAAATG